MYRKWKPSKSKIREFAKQMQLITEFCKKNGIYKSRDSYYFFLNGQNYRVSNHTIEASNNKAFDDMGNQIREIYHPEGREKDTIYITASKTRIIEIYENLKKGLKLNKRGYIIL